MHRRAGASVDGHHQGAVTEQDSLGYPLITPARETEGKKGRLSGIA
jgi:hypothetical protein